MRPLAFHGADYAELLGLYLGDGDIAHLPRTQRLRLSLDSTYPVLNAHAAGLLERCFPANQVLRQLREDGAREVIGVHHGHLTCLFPQHGPGKKHERRIVLEPWQRRAVAAHPWGLLRGLIWSDGAHYVNRTGPYEYFSYDFSNHSQDILDLFCDTAAALGVEARRYRRRVRIYRRDSVALVVANVGTKA